MEKVQQLSEVFLELSKKTVNPKALLDAFCRNVWSFEDKQEKCFYALERNFKFLPQEQQTEMIPLLINNSETYPRLVFLAEELFNALPTSEQERLNIPMIYWTTDDKVTHISEAEYHWRVKHQLPCWVCRGGYARPIEWEQDLCCFNAVIRMMAESSSKTLIYMRG